MKRINLCWSLFLILLCFISAPVVFAATDTGDSIKSDPSVVDVSMILWTRFGRIVSNQRRSPNEPKIYQRVQGNNCSIA